MQCDGVRGEVGGREKQIPRAAALMTTALGAKETEGFLTTFGMTAGCWADGCRVEVHCYKCPRAPQKTAGALGYKVRPGGAAPRRRAAPR